MTITPTTELQAVNAMLSSIGEAPVSDLVSPREDVQRALNTLEDVAREVQVRGWRFNTEINVKLMPVGEVEQDGVVLNVFKAPEDAASFTATWRQEQLDMDLIVRMSRVYLEDAAKVLIIADRRTGLDGFRQSVLYIDPVWFLESLGYMPESARRAIVATAARRFAADQGALDRVQVSMQDEGRAWRQLLKEQSLTTRHSFLGDNMTLDFMGRRPGSASFLPNRDFIR
jgi:hypothetical protein